MTDLTRLITCHHFFELKLSETRKQRLNWFGSEKGKEGPLDTKKEKSGETLRPETTFYDR